MCQLLGMNCNTPTDIIFSFEGFRKRGGQTGPHTDGFGIVFFEGKGVRTFLDNHSSCTSPVAELIKQYPIKCLNAISHIRKATQGHNSLVNTHPFTREIWGEYWVFAHNGQLCNFQPEIGNYYTPVGESDSELIFCYFLESLKKKYKSQKPSKHEIIETIYELANKISDHGILNFLISNGEWMIAYANTLLFYKIRQAPFGEVKLLDDDLSVDFSKETSVNDVVTVIATLPLTTNEKWMQLAKNELIMFEQGKIIYKKRPEKPVFMSVKEGMELAKAYSVF